MRRDKIFLFGLALLSLWTVVTYVLFTLRPRQDPASAEESLRRQLSFKREVDGFGKRLRAQLDENSLLLKQVRELRNAQIVGKSSENDDVDAKDIVKKRKVFVDAANEYEDTGKADEDDEVVEKDGVVIPVLMFACNRVTVAKALDSLLSYRTDPAKFPIIVSQDCGHAETRKVLLGYGDRISVVAPPPFPADFPIPPKEKKFKGYFKIARHYGWALNHTFQDLGHSQVIIVEDDLEVAPDFFDYFEATLPILRADKSLFCVSAWNDNGKANVIDESRPDLLYRSDFFGGLGWMMTRELWDELKVKWPKSYWDDWIRNPGQRRERACLRPEVSRTKTFGKVGVSNGLFFDKHLKHIVLSSQRVNFTRKNLDYLRKERYDAMMEETLNKIPVVRIEEVQSMSAHARHAAVRVLYHTKTAFKKSAKTLGIMDDFKAGVPRMAYRGVVSVMNRGLRVYLSPSLSWKGYDPTW